MRFGVGARLEIAIALLIQSFDPLLLKAGGQGISIAVTIRSLDPTLQPRNRDLEIEGFLSGSTIAFTIRSVDRSLSNRLILQRLVGREVAIALANHSLDSTLQLVRRGSLSQSLSVSYNICTDKN